MNKKRYLSMLLCMALILVGLLSGCGSKTADPDDGNKVTPSVSGKDDLEFMEISISHWNGDSAFSSDDEVLKTIKEKFNVDFVSQNITWDDHTQKLQLWASTDSLADISAAYIRDTTQMYSWARDGVIRSLPSDLSAYPNLQKYMEENTKENCMVDGECYVIPKNVYLSQEETVMERVILYRWDLAQQAGITKEPANWDEFREMLLAIMKADPEGKNIGGMTAPSMGYLGYPMLCYSVPNACDDRWEKWNDTYVPAYFGGENLGDNVLATWNLMRDMYTEGTIDPDLPISTLELAQNKFLNGQAAALCVTSSIAATPSFGMDSSWKELYGNPMMDDCKILNLMPGANGETYYWSTSYSAAESIFSSHVDDKKMERILMIYDYLLSDEGIMLSKFGVEGESYEIVDGKLVADIDARNEKYPSTLALANVVSWVLPLPNGYENDAGYDDWYDEWVPSYIEQAKACKMPEYEPRCKSAFVQSGSTLVISPSDDGLRIMTGTKPVEEMWKEILEEYKQYGLEDTIQKVNDALK